MQSCGKLPSLSIKYCKRSVMPIFDNCPRGTRKECGVNRQSRVHTDAAVSVPWIEDNEGSIDHKVSKIYNVEVPKHGVKPFIR